MRHAGDILATKPQTLRPRHTEYRRMTRHVKEKEKEEEEEKKTRTPQLYAFATSNDKSCARFFLHHVQARSTPSKLAFDDLHLQTLVV